MTHDNAMVETVARAICDHGGKGTPVRELYQDADYWRAHAKAALEASHHAELVNALIFYAGNGSLSGHRRYLEDGGQLARDTLAKIGGDA